MRKTTFFLIMILLVSLWPSIVLGQSNAMTITTTVDGQPLELGSYEVINDNGRLLVPIRWASEALGATVSWDSENRIVIVKKEDLELLIPVDDYFIWFNGQEMILDVPAKLVNDRTMVPLRVVSEALRSSVYWIQEENKIEIYTNQELATMTVLKPFAYDEEELSWLAKIIYLEANGEPFEGLVGVGSVVVNRANSGQFPDSIKGVIFQEGQFTPVRTGKIYDVTPSEEAIKAAKWAMIGKDNTFGALYFWNPKISKSSFFSSKKRTVTIGNHYFAK